MDIFFKTLESWIVPLSSKSKRIKERGGGKGNESVDIGHIQHLDNEISNI